jgi:hypothetical protein
MATRETTRRRSRMRIAAAAAPRVAVLTVAAAVLALQGYALVVQREGASPLPPLFGNFPANRAHLEQKGQKADFSFAVIGDTMSYGTFERIAEDLSRMDLDFAVLLGDCTFEGTEDEHRYLRAEWAGELAMEIPVFYAAGNHDVSPDKFPIARFEEDYGPSIFSFEYQGCLFIVLRTLDNFPNEDSLEFLRRLQAGGLGRYRYRFAFLHTPPPISPLIQARPFKESAELLMLMDRLKVDYAFAGDFHGYARVQRASLTWIVTGGGGGKLNKQITSQFHHAFVMKVGKDSIEERLVSRPRSINFEDVLERFAIVRLWPAMARNWAWFAVVDVACLYLICAALAPSRIGAWLRRTPGTSAA